MRMLRSLRIRFFSDLFGFGDLLAQLFGLLISAVASCLSFLSLAISSVALLRLGFECFGFGDGGAAFDIDDMKILKHGFRIHAALTEFFFNQREMIAYEGQIEHKKSE